MTTQTKRSKVKINRVLWAEIIGEDEYRIEDDPQAIKGLDNLAKKLKERGSNGDNRENSEKS